MGIEKNRRPLLAHELLDDHPVVGGLYMQDNATTTPIAVQGDGYVANGVATLKVGSRFFEGNAATGLTFKPAQNRPRVFKATLLASVIATNNQTVQLSLALNGVRQEETHMEVITTGGTGRREPLGTQGIFELQPGDTLAPMVANLTSTNNITVHDMTFIVEAIN